MVNPMSRSPIEGVYLVSLHVFFGPLRIWAVISGPALQWYRIPLSERSSLVMAFDFGDIGRLT